MSVNNIAVLSLLVCIFLILFLVIDIKGKFDNYLKDKDEKPLVTAAIIIGILFLLYGLLSPFISDYFFDFRKDEDGKLTKLNPNELGDTLGGTIGPFVGAAGVIFTFLAFYMQKVANDEIRKQFKIQQFESQFYEMIRLYKDNLDEIELFARRKFEVRDLNGDLTGYQYENYTVSRRDAFKEFKNEFEFILRKIIASNLEIIDEDSFKEAYSVFFWGLKDIELFNLADRIAIQSRTYDFESILYKMQEIQFSEQVLEFNQGYKFEIEAFKGHSEFLGHYYRHLYHIVKFIVNNESLVYDEKMKYLSMLRAQLSNYEQIMLFYNWLSGYGEGWENDENKFFTEYKMIHNLWYSELYETEFISNAIEDLKNTSVKLRVGNLFEADD